MRLCGLPRESPIGYGNSIFVACNGFYLFESSCLGSRAAIYIRFHCLIFPVGDAAQPGHHWLLAPLLLGCRMKQGETMYN